MSDLRDKAAILTPLEKVNGCMALLIDLCMKDTNATEFTIKSEGVTYMGELLGDYELVIKKLTPGKEG